MTTRCNLQSEKRKKGRETKKADIVKVEEGRVTAAQVYREM